MSPSTVASLGRHVEGERRDALGPGGGVVLCQQLERARHGPGKEGAEGSPGGIRGGNQGAWDPNRPTPRSHQRKKMFVSVFGVKSAKYQGDDFPRVSLCSKASLRETDS